MFRAKISLRDTSSAFFFQLWYFTNGAASTTVQQRERLDGSNLAISGNTTTVIGWKSVRFTWAAHYKPQLFFCGVSILQQAWKSRIGMWIAASEKDPAWWRMGRLQAWKHSTGKFMDCKPDSRVWKFWIRGWLHGIVWIGSWHPCLGLWQAWTVHPRVNISSVKDVISIQLAKRGAWDISYQPYLMFFFFGGGQGGPGGPLK